MHRVSTAVTLAGLGLALSPPVLGQSGSNEALSEIVVTAQRREETLFDVPVAVTALQGDFLEKQQVLTAEQLSLYTPSLHIYAEGVNTEFYTIRGIGRANEDLASDSGVAMFIDDVYVARQGAANLTLFDVERVEVLRGPQGTLWGKNATGGAVSIITRKPENEPGGYVGADAGDYGTLNLRAAVNVPFSDTVSGRLAAISRQRDGLYDNLETGETGNDVDQQAVRGSLAFHPSDRTGILLAADWAESEQDGVLKSVIVDVPGTLFVLKDFYTVTFPTQEEDLRSSRSGDNGSQGVEQYGGLLRIDHDFDQVTFSSITGARSEESHHSEDNDHAPERSGFVFSTQDTSSFSQEFRLSSAGDGAFTWTAGLYWFHEDGDRNQGRYSDFFGPGGLIGPGSPELQDSTTTFEQHITTDSYAVFGQATYAFNDAWRLTLGGRYTDETKDFDINAYSVANQPGGDPWSLFIPDGDFTASDEHGWNQFTPKAVLEFEPVDSINTYLSYAEGFKSGGYNGQPDNAAGVVPFEPELATTWEIGMKARAGGLSANLAYFFTDFEDMQLQGIDPVTGSPITNNAASAEISGLEVELSGRFGDGFFFNVAASWLQHEFRDYFIEVFDPTIQNGPPFRIVDKEGDRLSLIPEYNYHIGAGYEWTVSGDGLLTLSADYSAVDKTITEYDTLWSPSYDVTDVRLQWDSGASWTVALWVRNAFDEDYYRGSGPVPDLNDRTTRLGLLSDPRIIGLSVDWRYGQ